MKIDVITLDNGTAGTAELPDEFFAATPREDIMARVVHWQQARRRAVVEGDDVDLHAAAPSPAVVANAAG